MKTINEVLSQYFGYDTFREGQEQFISSILSKQDTFGIMPTGGGKSICYQLPAVMLNGITIVVTPLISLMQDQVMALKLVNIPCAYINSTLTAKEMSTILDNANQGMYKIIYTAPERLLNADFLQFATNSNISMVTVDEAHCISKWGQDFRKSYLDIPTFVNKLANRPILSAFTATATENVRLDIIKILQLKKPFVKVTGFDRPNLFLEVRHPKNKFDELIRFLNNNKNKSGIVYCISRKTVEEVCQKLNDNGYTASRYHAGLSNTERTNNQNDFINDKINIMVATNAFGMGIDKSNVSFVVHYNMPKDIDSYYQEAGRAGRDGNKAHCVMFYSGQDVEVNKLLIEKPNVDAVTDHSKEYERLKMMNFYSTTTSCLRGFLLNYFNEKSEHYCGNCSNCLNEFTEEDITIISQKILSCIARLKQNFGIVMVIDVLRGSKNQKILNWKFNELSVYGICTEKVSYIRTVITYLINNGYIAQSDDKHPTLILTNTSKQILKENKQIIAKMPIDKNDTATEYKTSQPKTLTNDYSTELFNSLRLIRYELAKSERVPPYLIFSDKTLIDMCVKSPTTLDEFLNVSGVGELKLNKYGSKFINAIINYNNTTEE